MYDRGEAFIRGIIYDMDDVNAYIGNSEAFPILKTWTSTTTPACPPAASIGGGGDGLRAAFAVAVVSERQLAAGDGGDARGGGELLHCDKSEVAFVQNTATGLSIVARGIDWHTGT